MTIPNSEGDTSSSHYVHREYNPIPGDHKCAGELHQFSMDDLQIVRDLASGAADGEIKLGMPRLSSPVSPRPSTPSATQSLSAPCSSP